MRYNQLGFLGAAVTFSLAGCGSDAAFSSGAADGGSDGSVGRDGGDGAAPMPPGDAASDAFDAARVTDAAADAEASAPPLDLCSALGDVKFCKVASVNDGVATCMQRPDNSLVYGPCIATACDATATPSAAEACVPAADFTMGGLDGAMGTTSEGDTLPAHTVSIRHRFYIDKFEVSLGEFNAWWNATPRTTPTDGALIFVSGAHDVIRWVTPAGGLKAPAADLGYGCVLGFGVNDLTKIPASINCLPYETALAYCVAEGKRLPTEAEWELVATGQGANNIFPWGDALPDDSCVQTVDGPCAAMHPGTIPSYRVAAAQGNTPMAMGSVNNLAGNLAEWTLDFYPPAGCVGTSTCFPTGMLDPLGATDNNQGRVTRGGSFASTVDQVRTRARDRLNMADPAPTTKDGANVGFRCVRDER